ncbi:MAG TPA: hypothetical protein DCS93_28095 [Microscillaceae bacterium]|nr:hypothetical protein [Microscillaceae bacterium]
MSKKILFLILCSFFLLALAGLWYFEQTQPSVNYDQCELCDGRQYEAAYDYFQGQQENYQVKFPFHSRVLVPWLAAQFSFKSPKQAFVIILWGCTLLTVLWLVLSWHWLDIPWYLQIIGIGWLLLHWTGIIRFNLYDPITVDAPSYVFHSLLVLLLIRPRWLWLLLLITPLATAQKESWLAILLVLALYEFVYQQFFNAKATYRKLWIYTGAVVLSLVIKWWLNEWFVPSNGTGKNSLITILFFIKITLQNPLDLVRWVVAMFIGFGGFWLLAWQKLWKRPRQSGELQMTLGVLVVLHLAFGVLAGRDMTRIMFLGFPFIMTSIFLLIRDESLTLIAVVTILGLPILRLISAIPSQVNQNQVFKTWFPEYAPLDVVGAWAVYMVICYWLIAKLRKWLQ